MTRTSAAAATASAVVVDAGGAPVFQAGTFKYLCIPHHGDGMYGEVVMVPRS